MEPVNKEMEFMEICPKCNSMSCTTDLSSDDRKTKCNSCGFEGNISRFREHEGKEPSQEPIQQRDQFGRKRFLDPTEESKRIQLLKKLDIEL